MPPDMTRRLLSSHRGLASLGAVAENTATATTPLASVASVLGTSPLLGKNASSPLVHEPWRQNLLGSDEARLRGKRDEKWWYTGKTPQTAPGFQNGKLRSLAQPRLDRVTKHETLAYFQNTWALYELLFSSLQGEEAFYRPPQHGLRHPMQFYYGHTAVFYINKSVVAGLLDKPIEPSFESQFEVGVDEMRWDDMTLGDKLWPRVSAVTEYRREAYNTMVDLIERNFMSGPQSIGWDHPLWSVFMGCEHDRIHIETSSVLIRELPLELVRKPEFWPDAYQASKESSKTFPKNELVSVKGERVKLGKEWNYPTYGWDNEYGRRDVNVADFKASKFMVSNGEFLEFVKAGGYRERKYWSEDGWGWRRFRNAQHPFFWVRNGPAGSHKYLLRHTFETGEFALNLPAVVNYHEAKAFCAWKQEQDPSKYSGLRLMSEAEHQLINDEAHRMSTATPDTDPAVLAGGSELETKFNVNLGLAVGSERPVDARPVNKQGFHDGVGNVWQWCEDEMAPMPGFKTHPYYGDFTEPCFDGKHKIIKGGSFISTGDNGANAHCRYHFRPHFLQHSGIRYALPSKSESRPGESGGAVFLSPHPNEQHLKAEKTKAASQAQQTQADYELERMVNQYLALHFGKESPLIPHKNAPDHALDFPRRCATLLADCFSKFSSTTSLNKARALDIGCAVGGSTFQLAALGFQESVGVDLSKAFVAAADTMRSNGKSTFRLDTDKQDMTVSLLQKESEARSRTRFMVGDACKLPLKDLGQFDAVLGANLLCRLPDPHACLNQLPELVKKGGIVLFVSPFSWLPGFTEENRWLGPVGQSEKELEHEMRSLGFSKVHEEDVPLIIRDHRRKYQYIVSSGMAFKNDN